MKFGAEKRRLRYGRRKEKRSFGCETHKGKPFYVVYRERIRKNIWYCPFQIGEEDWPYLKKQQIAGRNCHAPNVLNRKGKTAFFPF